ncbi:RagB/SusD family nutrient uptake outer membrane protein [Chryseobacterium sp. JAH]|uniref:RagB/SusD family nutrient uptake outer membrane protein n=1 Tax=Chryseobacterium sp. JAH TaxID=1742858 RepID=UPI0006474E56|nr:RagB/SusD family nutrient uptake outer membrane protein [Chryseobacterium sp. JAH]KUJ51534.1 carbohydrate-binding protein SusD [Chryseobacterium sp. JAH]
MKKIILTLVFATSLFNSCNDFIEEESLAFAPADEAFKTAAGYQLLVNSNYAWLKGIYGGDPWLFVAGTDMYAEGRTPEPAGLSQYTQLIPASEGVDQLYVSCYQLIQSVNKTVYYSTLTEQTPSVPMMVGEARFLRANAYFLLVQTYGGVPIVEENFITPVLKFDRNTAPEVYTYIIKELEASLAAVGIANYATSGRVNKKAVNDLLAKVYLTRGYETFGLPTDFTKAAEYAEAAIAGQALTMTPAQLSSPGPSSELGPETIFSVQYDLQSTTTSPTTLGNKQFYYFSSYLGGAETQGNAPLRSYNLCPTKYAIDLFKQGDLRWESTFMNIVYERYYDFFRVADKSTLKIKHFYEPSWYTAADKTTWMTANTSKLATGFVYHDKGTYDAAYTLVKNIDYQTIPVKKFDDPALTTPASTGPVSTRDIIISRLADTYLIAAEAYLKAGNSATGLARLNAVRARAGVANASLAEFNINYILDERGREMLGEYNRWFDLKRTGTLVSRAVQYNYKIPNASNFNGNNGVQKILRPIPQTVIDLNQNKAFPQNPAY